MKKILLTKDYLQKEKLFDINQVNVEVGTVITSITYYPSTEEQLYLDKWLSFKSYGVITEKHGIRGLFLTDFFRYITLYAYKHSHTIIELANKSFEEIQELMTVSKVSDSKDKWFIYGELVDKEKVWNELLPTYYTWLMKFK